MTVCQTFSTTAWINISMKAYAIHNIQTQLKFAVLKTIMYMHKINAFIQLQPNTLLTFEWLHVWSLGVAPQQ